MKHLDPGPLFPVTVGANLVVALISMLPPPLRIGSIVALLLLFLLSSFLWMRHSFSQIPNNTSGKPDSETRHSHKRKKHHKQHKRHKGRSTKAVD